MLRKIKKEYNKAKRLWNSDNEELIKAAENTDFEKVLYLLQKGVKINYKNGNGDTVLIEVAFQGKYDIAELLLWNGAKTNKKNNSGQTALYVAAMENHEEIVDLLLKYGADTNIGANSSNNHTCLMQAIFNDNITMVKKLLEKDANLKCKDILGETPLHLASNCKKNSAAIIKELIKNGAEKEAKCRLGRTPLISAAAQKNHGALKQLLAEHSEVDAQDNNGYTALMLGAEEHCLETVKILYANGANVNFGETYDGDTPLHIAIKSNSKDISIFLIQVDANPRIPNKKGLTPYDIASQDIKDLINEMEKDLLMVPKTNGLSVERMSEPTNQSLRLHHKQNPPLTQTTNTLRSLPNIC